MNMISSSSQARLHAALNKPMFMRFGELEVALTDSLQKDLVPFLPVLLESIFGMNGQPGWGIATMRVQQHEFVNFRNFLAPEGPLLKAIYRLATDPGIRFEFPLSCVNPEARAVIEEGGMLPGFYSEKLQLSASGQLGGCLHLNAFEYYFFCFAYYLVAPANRKHIYWTNVADFLYPILVEDYVDYFLPVGSHRTPPQLFAVGHRNLSLSSHMTPQAGGHMNHHMTSHVGGPANQSVAASPKNKKSPQGPTLLSMNAVLRASRPTPSQSFISVSAPVYSAEIETSHANSFLQIMLETWFSPNWTDSSSRIRNIPLSPSSPNSSEDNLPSVDQLRLTRLLIKHIHYLTNNCSTSSPASYGTMGHHGVSHWEDFKRSVGQIHMKKKVYKLLKHCFEHWPLDTSFRVVLETWLSYIQPWRYVDYLQKDRDASSEKGIESEKWFNFVADNLLFYTVSLDRMIQRLLRMDLATTRNVVMAFRLSKVFATKNLPAIIAEAESKMFEPSASPKRLPDLTPSSMHRQHHTPTQPRGSPLSTRGVVLQVSDLEGPLYHYERIFSTKGQAMVEGLLRQLVSAKTSITAQYYTKESGGGFLAMLGFGDDGPAGPDFNAISISSRHDVDMDFNSMPDKRIENILDQTIAFFSEIFQLTPPSAQDQNSQLMNSSLSLSPEVWETDDGREISPRGKYQMMYRLRKFDILPNCDPEVLPVRSYENALLVRMFISLASYLNTEYGAFFEKTCTRPDIIGSAARYFLYQPLPPGSSLDRLPPHTAQRYREYSSKPRVSFRCLANYSNIGYLVLCYLFCYLLFGMGPVGFICLLLALFVMYALWMGYVKRSEGSKSEADLKTE